MYSLSQLRRAVREPHRIRAELRKRYWQAYSRYQRDVRGRSSPPMPERDWDTLVVLDACRYDIFAGRHGLGGTAERHYSAASNTAEWLERLFVGREFPDLVYVTATPKYLRQDLAETFHDIVPVWQSDWDEELRTVPPDVMTDRVVQAHEEYPDKRVLAHYIQPHIPFIGEKGRAIPHEVVFAQTVIRQDTDQQNIWDAIRTGDLDRDRAFEAYVENLDVALPAVERLLSAVEGLTVVTADHGNVFGEHGLYGHPPRRHVPELITVPWLEHGSGERRDVRAGEIRSQRAHYEAATAEEDVDQRLAALGYV